MLATGRPRRRRRRIGFRRLGLAVAVAALLAAGGAWAESRSGDDAHTATRTAAKPDSATAAPDRTAPGAVPARTARRRLEFTRIGRLPQALQDPAVTVLGGAVYAFGGLEASQASSASVVRIASGGVRALKALPTPLHDAAAAVVGSRLYVLGGGQATSYSGIGRYSPASGATALVGSLPTPLSDLAAVSTGSSAFLVGGYTGQVFSDHVLAYSGGRRARIAGTLPQGLRYAAVAPLAGRVMIAGGRTGSGPSRDILSFDPATGHVARVGSLPQPLMHAEAAALGGVMYVIGGITAAGRPTDQVVAVTPSGRAHVVARLPHPLSDAGVAATPAGLVIVGGSDGTRPVSSVLRLGWTTAHARARRHHRGAAGPLPAMFHGPLPGDLLIADRGNNRMLIVTPAHHVIWQFPRPGSKVSLYFDDDTFFAPSGHEIISNEEEHQDIIRVSYPGGKLVWRYGHPGQAGSAPGYMNTPDDAYALPGGLVIVADAYNCRVLEIRGQRVVRILGTTGVCVHNPPASFGDINGDTPLRNGHVLISEINGGYIDDMTLSGKLVHVYKAPVSYASDPQLTRNGNIIVADYARPGGVVILNRRTGAVMWSYRPSAGPGMLDHPSLAAMLPNGDVIVGDDFNDRVVVIDPRTKRIVWQYGHTAVGGTAPGYLHIPDGFEFIPVRPDGSPDPAMIWKTRY
ncbi:MAG TPA: PQQ-binding-like beta-propeller repeat protein [Gaiellales bacterium]|nr:PQQ-binding-like beta-propeller repeat protein [Gaiellales bacterium]